MIHTVRSCSGRAGKPAVLTITNQKPDSGGGWIALEAPEEEFIAFWVEGCTRHK